ncbi:M20/M25/M40 family metallo-hydrolase [Agrococcus casei]|uniref:M20/M25/M40 family metallo-hydrolase n=2 Tax=Agrococcus casei TaxID=343512 RepID=UPI003F9353E8
MGSAALSHGRYEAEMSLLRQLVEIETPSGDTAASALIADVIAERMRELGGEVVLHETSNGVNLVADFAGSGEPLLLVGHTDTVWPVGTLAGRVPWSIVDGVVRGPGAYDMKAGITVMLAALSRLQGAERRAVRIVLVCDEEIGSPTSQQLLREATDGCAGAIGFESPHPDGALKLGRRGSVRVRVDVTGRAAHAALDPELGVSAVDELVDQLLRIREFVGAPELQPVLCNVGTVSGGTRANVVPDAASAEIGLRFVNAETEQTVLDWISSLEPVREGAAVSAVRLSHRPTWQPSAADDALLEQVRAAAGAVGQQIGARPAAGAGDTNLIGSLGIATLDGFGPAGGGAHAVDEHFRVESFGERIELLTALLAL